MERYDIYKDIASRTGGDIYIGVVGPVRTGKSTFISRFMEKLVIPNITNKLQKQIATDVLHRRNCKTEISRCKDCVYRTMYRQEKRSTIHRKCGLYLDI